MKYRLGAAMGLMMGFSTAGHSADLLDIFNAAKDNDPNYQAAEYQYQAGLLQEPIARSALRPQFSVGGGLNGIREDINSDNPLNPSNDDTYNNANASLSLNQILYDRQTRIAVDQATQVGLQSTINFAIAEEDLIIRVVTRYLAVLAALDNLDAAEGEKVAIQRQLELADERLQVGLGTRTDLFDAEARFQIADAQVLEALNLIEDAQQGLVELIGYDPGDLDRLREDAPLDAPVPEVQDEWVDLAKRQNRELLVAEIDTRISEQEIERQKAGRSPIFDLGLDHDLNDSNGVDFGDSRRNVTTLGVRLIWPIYQGGLISNRVEEAALNHNATREFYDALVRSVDRTTRDAYFTVLTSISRVNALDKAVIANESAVEARQEGFAAGLITNIDVLDAQRDLYASIRDYLAERYNYILSRLQLEQVAGELDMSDLEVANTWLE